MSEPQKATMYCIGCELALLGESMKYCNNRNCKRYGLHTMLTYPDKPKYGKIKND